ncbi:MAG: DUF4239 domain-containing protein [Candidatus Omnitrophica bacterium]|nr:DUF4239 domain-containing protein [Candidatus Omnitrophota bacterium]
MSFTQWLIVNVPSALLGALVVVVSVGISAVSLFLVRRFIPHKKFKVHNDVAGAMFGTVGVAYAVLLAFVAVIVWGDFNKASENVEREANCVASLYAYTEAFAPSSAVPIRAALKKYARLVTHEEWPMLAIAQESNRVAECVQEIGTLYAGYLPAGTTDTVYFSLSVEKFNELCQLRRERLYAAGNGVHPVFWVVLIAGALVTITFTVFFGSENTGAHHMMAMLLASLIGLILFTVPVFDYPFSGSVSIPARAFNRILSY